uniref:Uncharacterized protein n=1 Tax=Lotus japonicus TaxID=34305 RepID=I3SS96_LOTJA|nr:unknown [Lotus japonicus]
MGRGGWPLHTFFQQTWMVLEEAEEEKLTHIQKGQQNEGEGDKGALMIFMYDKQEREFIY